MENRVLHQHLVNYYGHTLQDFWTPERQLVETGYQTLTFPVQEMPSPSYVMQAEWTLEQFFGYLYTWSATQRFIAAHQQNPLKPLLSTFELLTTSDRIKLSWPIHLRAGRLQNK